MSVFEELHHILEQTLFPALTKCGFTQNLIEQDAEKLALKCWAPRKWCFWIVQLSFYHWTTSDFTLFDTLGLYYKFMHPRLYHKYGLPPGFIENADGELLPDVIDLGISLKALQQHAEYGKIWGAIPLQGAQLEEEIRQISSVIETEGGAWFQKMTNIKRALTNVEHEIEVYKPNPPDRNFLYERYSAAGFFATRLQDEQKAQEYFRLKNLQSWVEA